MHGAIVRNLARLWRSASLAAELPMKTIALLADVVRDYTGGRSASRFLSMPLFWRKIGVD
jgi:hypothetical protein